MLFGFSINYSTYLAAETNHTFKKNLEQPLNFVCKVPKKHPSFFLYKKHCVFFQPPVLPKPKLNRNGVDTHPQHPLAGPDTHPQHPLVGGSQYPPTDPHHPNPNGTTATDARLNCYDSRLQDVPPKEAEPRSAGKRMSEYSSGDKRSENGTSGDGTSNSLHEIQQVRQNTLGPYFLKIDEELRY